MKFLLSLILLIFTSTSVYADSVVLKSGKIMEGKIIEQANEYVKIDIDGVAITYFMDEIAQVIKSDPSGANINPLDRTTAYVGSPTMALSDEAIELLEKARIALVQGDYEKSIEYLNNAIALHPETSQLYTNVGMVYWAAGQIDKGISSLEEAIKLNPKDPNAYSNLAGIYKTTGNFGKAIESLKKAIELEPEEADFYFNIGTIYNSNLQYAEAKEALNQALTMRSKSVPEKVYLAMCYMHLGYAQGGLGEFEDAQKNVLTARKLFEELNDKTNLDYIDGLLEKIKQELEKA